MLGVLVSSESTFKADKFFFYIGLANRGLNRFQSWIKTRDSSRFATHCLKCKKKYVSGVLKERTPETLSLFRKEYLQVLRLYDTTFVIMKTAISLLTLECPRKIIVKGEKRYNQIWTNLSHMGGKNSPKQVTSISQTQLITFQFDTFAFQVLFGPLMV